MTNENYRDLQPHEIIQKGDEFYSTYENDWVDCDASIGDPVEAWQKRFFSQNILIQFRRPVITVKDAPPAPEYRTLGPEDIVLNGDEFFCIPDGTWKPCQTSVGDRVKDWEDGDIFGNFRRRVKVSEQVAKQRLEICQTCAAPITPTPEYPDEIIKEGDQFFAVWHKCSEYRLLRQDVPSRGYRLVQAGEQVLKEDQRYFGGDWCPVFCLGLSDGSRIIRRPIGDHENFSGFRLLEQDEVIKDGDEVLTKDADGNRHWHKCYAGIGSLKASGYPTQLVRRSTAVEPTKDARPAFRRVRSEELIQTGDEFSDDNGATWTRCRYTVNSPVSYFSPGPTIVRRKVS